MSKLVGDLLLLASSDAKSWTHEKGDLSCGYLCLNFDLFSIYGMANGIIHINCQYLKSPLAVILANAERLDQLQIDNTDFRKSVNILDKECMRMSLQVSLNSRHFSFR